MENGFGEARAKGARSVNVLIGHLSPFVYSDRFVPDAADEGCFFLGSLCTPGVIPVLVGIPW